MNEPTTLKAKVASFEKAEIIAALDDCSGIQAHAAMLLGIARITLIRKMVRHGIERPVDRRKHT